MKYTYSPFYRLVAALLLPCVWFTAMPVGAYAFFWGAMTGPKAPVFSPETGKPTPVLTPKKVVRNPGVKIKPRVLASQFSAEPTESEIELASCLDRPLKRTVSRKGVVVENRAVAEALKYYEANGAHTKVSSLTKLQDFATSYPLSDWTAPILVQLGDVYFHNGFFNRAEQSWRQAYALAVQASPQQSSDLADRALSSLLNYYARFGQKETLRTLIQTAQTRPGGSEAKLSLDRAREILHFLDVKAEQNIFCGLMALNSACKEQPQFKPLFPDVHDPVEGKQFIEKGFSLFDVEEHAGEGGAKMQAARRLSGEIPVPCVIHWKFNHYSAIKEVKDGMYRVEDPYIRFNAWVSAEALQEEGSGYFVIPEGKLPAGWEAVSEAKARTIFGRHCTHARSDEGPQKNCKGDCGPCPCPMATYDLRLLDAGVVLADTPVSFPVPFGPKIAVKLTYDQRSTAIPGSFAFSNFGPRWTHNYMAYLSLTGSGTPISQVKLIQQNVLYTFNYDSGTSRYRTSLDDSLQLTRISSTQFELIASDGSKKVFDVPDAVTPTKLFLGKEIDAQGNKLTFSYDSSERLLQIANDLSQKITFDYTHTDPLLITKITDEFSRVATFQYDGSARLQRIIDPIGITSEFTYDGSGFITQLTTPYGTTKFRFGDYGAPSPGTDARWVEAEDPFGEVERVEATDVGSVPVTTAFPPGSPISVGGTNVTFLQFNDNLHFRNTYHWDKKMWKEGKGDYTKAKIYHWSADGGNTVGVLESEKAPLEERVWYNYPGQTAVTAPGTMPMPSKIARRMADYDGSLVTQLVQREYNSIGRITREVDPLGRDTLYEYDTNKIDLLKVKQQHGANTDVLMHALTYNAAHRPLTVKDSSGRLTTLTYNAKGQVTTITNAKNEVTTWNYDGNNFLVNLTQTDPVTSTVTTLATYTYDGFNRVRTRTDANGYKITYDYDVLDRLTALSYEDGTYEQISYDKLDVAWQRDRLGQWTHTIYDTLRHPLSVEDPAGRITTYDWCKCGALNALVDARGQRTTWTRDLQQRVIAKTLADGTGTKYGYEALTSRLKSMTDAKGQVTSYVYNRDNTLNKAGFTKTISPTSSISYSYDTYFLRLSSWNDGTGTTTNTYNNYFTSTAWGASGPTPSTGIGQLNNEAKTSSSANYTTTFAYDELGRVTSRTIDSGTASTWAYDYLGRVSSLVNALGTFTPAYHATKVFCLTSLTYPSGQVTGYTYDTSANGNRLLEINNLNASAAVLSKFNYAYNGNGQITQWTQQSESQTALQYGLQYDPASQLVGAVLKNTGTGAVMKNFVYGYDAAGNRGTEQIDSAVVTSTYNTGNQLTGIQAGGTMKFAGTLTETGSVTVGGTPGTVSGTNFWGNATVTAGTNTVPVIAKDLSGMARTNNYQVVVANGSSRTLTYDPNGNLLNDGNGKKYTWDARNQMVKITYTDASTSEFTYDGRGRRVKIVEKDSGGSVISTKQFVWCGLEMCEERDGSNAVTKRFYPQGERMGSTSYYFTKDHLGSIREMTDSSSAITAAYSYDPYGRQETSVPTSGLKLWLKADAGITKDGSNRVSAWADQSGNGNNASQATGAKQPLFTASGINGQPSVTFDGSNDGMQLGSALADASETTMITAFKSQHSTTFGPIFSDADTATDKDYVFWFYSTQFYVRGDKNGKTIFTGINLDTNITNTPGMATWTMNGTKSQAWLNGRFQGTANYGGSNVGNHNANPSVGQYWDGAWDGSPTWGSYYNGELGDLLIYGRELTQAERTRVETSLAKKYGLSKPESDFRYTGHYYHEKSGLSLAPFRSYDADLGRWISRDSIAENGGINLYAYCKSDPINYVDPLGLMSWTGIAAIGVIGAGLIAAAVLASPAIAIVAGTAALGAAFSAATDGDIAVGAATGAIGAGVGLVAGPAIGGAVGGGLGGAAGAAQGCNPTPGKILTGALLGAVVGAAVGAGAAKAIPVPGANVASTDPGVSQATSDAIGAAAGTVAGGAVDLFTGLTF